jgi:endonuclease YncB( thermonuclease family)
MLRLVIFAAFAALATPALADPCTFIPDNGPAPSEVLYGRNFSGRVTYVGDGDSLCVALGALPSRWVEVRLDDFYAPELASPEGQRAKSALRRLALGQQLLCNGEKQSYDRVIAHCTLRGRSVGDLMREAGVPEGGRAYRR